jgi:hypothetical protein
MHTRHNFLVGAPAPALLATAARAKVRCVPDPKHGGQMCKTSIDFTDAFQETYHARHEPAAIWIACVAVVFATYGVFDPMPMIGPRALDIDEVVPKGAGGDLQYAIRMKLEKV